MTRRTLLSATAAPALATASPALLSTPEQAAGRRKLRVGVVGCGRMGQYFAEAYQRMPDTELAAIAEWNDERRKLVGERFRVKALFKDAPAMMRDQKLDLVAIITPTKFMNEAVLVAAEAEVAGISTDKPIAAKLADADEMVQACEKRKIVFAGGNLQRARWQTQVVAQRLRAGQYGKIVGAAVHGYGGEISGGGCQHVSMLHLLTGAEVSEVMAWGYPVKALERDDDQGLMINGRWRLSNGLECPVFGDRDPLSGVEVWTDRGTSVRWSWNAPRIFEQAGRNGSRKEVDAAYPPFPWKHIFEKPPLRPDDDYLVASIRSFVDTVHLRRPSSSLFISGKDLRQALEVAIACKQSARQGNASVPLPLADRSLALLPSPYRWLGGDAVGSVQTLEEAAGLK